MLLAKGEGPDSRNKLIGVLMLSEAEYRKVVGEVCRTALSDNNDFILSLAMSGLLLLPTLGTKKPFSHYVIAPMSVFEIQKDGKPLAGWKESWIVDFDWKENKRPEAAFTFTPLKRIKHASS